MRKLTQQEQDRCKIAIAQNYHTEFTKKRKGWIILGDETGSLFEFKGMSSHRPSRMMWVVIPPNIDLPFLHPFYHGQDAEWFSEETLSALKNLTYADSVGCFTFTHQQGLVSDKLKSKVSNQEHLMMWQFTLPLILEWVASRNQKPDSVSVYIERVGELQPGEMPLASLMQEFVIGLQNRKSWARLTFKEHYVIAKEPLENPWLGYTDALGHIFNEEIPIEAEQIYHNVREKTISVPYRQDNLNSTIRELLKSTAKPRSPLISARRKTSASASVPPTAATSRLTRRLSRSW